MKDACLIEKEMIHHRPVLQKEVLRLLEPGNGPTVFVDATLGEGGYAELFLETFPGVVVLGVDRDIAIMEISRKRLHRFGSRVHFFNMWFDHFFGEYSYLFAGRPDRILFDLGISRYHFEEGNRGFSFGRDESLDMRLGPDIEVNAADIINTYSADDLSRIFGQYGEERYSYRIARAIVREREKQPITGSGRLAEIIRAAVPARVRYGGRIHPATRCFQALRIEVNSELVRLESAIADAFHVVKEGGRIGVISYHSLEDRIVKHFFRNKNKDCTCPPELPMCQCGGKRECVILTRKPVRPDEDEIRENHAARSARLRVAEKIFPERTSKGKEKR
ncbi:MAG: 16S rRNA (cytosine(1402)-N(4))-methyltransferase RsmH [Spirochaetales bacterium]|nr:16S rRNA (cytosine(1402)-N(4))-methyltransferase RsmH [Spirochaetales bacterium]